MATVKLHPTYARHCHATNEAPSADGERRWAVRMLAEWRRLRGYSADGEMDHDDHRDFASWVEVWA